MKNKSTTMNCPVCDVPLSLSVRQNVEIDYCPQCRGVWLDRGELDKVIERSVDEMAPPTAPEQSRGQDQRDRDRHGDRGHGGGHGSYGGHGRSGKQGYRRKSWLNELFD